MMYSCNDSDDLLHAFLTLTCPSAYYMLYCNMSIYCNTLGAIYRYGKIQYRPSSNIQCCTNTHTHTHTHTRTRTHTHTHTRTHTCTNIHTQVVDARSTARFEGTAQEPRPSLPSGHIVGAHSLPFYQMINSESKILKSKDEIREGNVTQEVNKSITLPLPRHPSTSTLTLAPSHTCARTQIHVYQSSCVLGWTWTKPWWAHVAVE